MNRETTQYNSPRPSGTGKRDGGPQRSSGARTRNDAPRTDSGSRTGGAPQSDAAPRSGSAPRSAGAPRTGGAPQSGNAPRPAGAQQSGNSLQNGDAHPQEGAVREVPAGRNATKLVYAPEQDGLADAGEIVWTWVPYEEDPAQGKDRPLLVVGRKGKRLHGLMLSSQAPDEREREDWLPIGAGNWDREGRDSYVRVDRLFEFDEAAIRREAAVMDERLFWKIAAVLRERYGWT